MSSHVSMDSMSSHYEAVRPRVTSQHVQSDRFPQPGAASTATRELDDLMASLSDFKVNPLTLQLTSLSSPICTALHDIYLVRPYPFCLFYTYSH